MPVFLLTHLKKKRFVNFLFQIILFGEILVTYLRHGIYGIWNKWHHDVHYENHHIQNRRIHFDADDVDLVLRIHFEMME